MKNNQESKSFWKGKGFYLALTLVIAGAATASFLAINSMMDKLGADPAPQIQGEEDIPWQEEQHTPVEEKQEDVPVAPTSPSSSSKPQSTASSAPSSSPASSAPAAPASSQPVQTPSFASPRAGAALQAFSGDELVFNDTMKDWRTHNGMDLAGAAGDAVTAPTGAVVARAYEDPQWGGVVELNAGKLTVRVCGLADIAVKEGDTPWPAGATPLKPQWAAARRERHGNACASGVPGGRRLCGPGGIFRPGRIRLRTNGGARTGRPVVRAPLPCARALEAHARDTANASRFMIFYGSPFHADGPAAE